MPILEKHRRGAVLVAQFNHEKPVNPMNRALEESIVETCQEVEQDPNVKALVLTGGEGRSFCAGQDLNELIDLTSPEVVEDLINRIIARYVVLLKVTKPTVAAIDGYAIGAGFQISLLCDWRIGSFEVKFSMLELKHGLAAPIGAYLLEKCFGRAAMTDILYGCEMLSVDWAEQNKLLNEVVEAGQLTEKAVRRAEVLASYPEITYRRTKEAVNRSFIDGLHDVALVAKKIHTEGFGRQAADEHIRRVLKH